MLLVGCIVKDALFGGSSTALDNTLSYWPSFYPRINYPGHFAELDVWYTRGCTTRVQRDLRYHGSGSLRRRHEARKIRIPLCLHVFASYHIATLTPDSAWFTNTRGKHSQKFALYIHTEGERGQTIMSRTISYPSSPKDTLLIVIDTLELDARIRKGNTIGRVFSLSRTAYRAGTLRPPYVHVQPLSPEDLVSELERWWSMSFFFTFPQC